jgi:hypothetical protein
MGGKEIGDRPRFLCRENVVCPLFPGMHIPRGYLYFAMAFSFAVEMLNICLRRRTVAVVELHKPIREEGER